MDDVKVPEILRGVMSSELNEALTVEDYARMAQVSAEQWEESLIDHVVELSPDQFCALFDLARRGLSAPGETPDALAARKASP